MGDDVLAERSPQEVAAWYGRLADLIDTKKIDNEKPIAPWALRGWLENANRPSSFWATNPGTSFVAEEVFRACPLGRSDELIAHNSSCGAFYNRAVACSCDY